MEWLNCAKIRLVLVGFFIAYMVVAVVGQTEDNNVGSETISAEGPRLGMVVVVEVTFPDRDALGELARAGYDISNVHGNIATICASLEELEWLKQTGYPLREINRQPQRQPEPGPQHRRNTATVGRGGCLLAARPGSIPL